MTHTPGPWTIDHQRIGPPGEPVALLCDTNAPNAAAVVDWPRGNDIDTAMSIDDTENEANAWLIASAPTMLAALVEIVADIEAYCYDHDSDRPTDLTVVLPTLQAAIARATGKEVAP